MTEMTPDGYVFKSSSLIAVMLKASLDAWCAVQNRSCVSFRHASLYTSDTRRSTYGCYACIVPYQVAITSALLIDEFSDLLTQYTTAPGDLMVTGDFNFHYDQPKCTYVSRLKTIFPDIKLHQVINEPTHWHGHILDRIVL